MAFFIKIILLSLLFLQNSFATYEHEIEINVDISTLTSPRVEFEHSTVTFTSVTPGANLNGSINVTLYGSSNREFLCNINNSGLEDVIEMFDAKVSLTLELNGCSPSSSGTVQTLTITSTNFPSNVNPASTDSKTITLSIAYEPSEITNYI